MIYKYKAYSTEKKLVEGRIEVASESLAETALYQAGFENIIALKEVTPGLGRLLPTSSGIKPKDIIDTSNQLATLVQSGITLASSLKLLEGQITKPALKKIFRGLIREIEAGNSLSQALSLYPQVFSNTYCQIIRASEQAGTLEAGFKQASKYMEKQNFAHQKIMRAMYYPVFVLLLAIGIAILLVMVALPPLISLFDSLHASLPWTTTLLLNISNFLMAHGIAVLIGLAVVVILIIVLLRNPSVKLARDKYILKMPIFGNIIIERSMGMFCQTASMLLQAGLRLPQVIEIVIQTNRNQVIRQALSDVRERLVQGEGLSQPMSENKLFPPLLVEMTMVGEKTGAMDTTLGTLAEFYEKEVDRKIDSLISMIEPALTIIIGVVVIFIALSMITPLYSILKSIH